MRLSGIGIIYGGYSASCGCRKNVAHYIDKHTVWPVTWKCDCGQVHEIHAINQNPYPDLPCETPDANDEAVPGSLRPVQDVGGNPVEQNENELTGF